MKPSFHIMREQVHLVDGSPIKVKGCDYDYFKYPLHCHPEYEIVYILKSSGLRFAGNTIEDFSDEDLTLFGPFLPHMYRNDESYHQASSERRVQAIIVQFSTDFFHQAIQLYPEFAAIKSLLENARRGICFEKEGNDAIRQGIRELTGLQGLNRLLACIRVLSLMSESLNARFLSDGNEAEKPVAYDDARIDKVLKKLGKDYCKEIKLKEIAELSHMNEAAFCRYFKKKTGQTLMQYVTRLRIGLACRLALVGELSTAQICYECGYNNLSNFNRHFRMITGKTPTEYRQTYLNDTRPIVVDEKKKTQ